MGKSRTCGAGQPGITGEFCRRIISVIGRAASTRHAVRAPEQGSPGMSYGVEQTRRFARQYKKLNDNVAADVDAAIGRVAVEPTMGDPKKGDLADLLVYKFRSQGQLYLLGYSLDDAVRLVYLEAIGSHENFYRDIKRN